MFDSETAAGTYTNPVYPRSFPDPFVLKYGGDYFAYSTGFASDGNVFAVLHSHDLVRWKEAGSAMKPLENSPPFYWAPEVICNNGKFYLYYSVGNETFMELRVAVSDRPDGGFVDSGRKLTTQDFAIDAHVFIDDDGSRWMFYATDFLDHTHIGTGTVVDRMLDLFTLEGKPRPVTRAKYDWQVYDPNRKEKGGVRWHTVEGPTVLKRKGLYYEMFSGGNWQNTTYGVSFAIAGDIGTPDEWMQLSDGVNVLPILRTIPGVVEGPGHNSVVRGPNNRELYCIYHRWINDERVLAIDRMDFAGDRLFVVGATSGAQHAPFQPAIDERFNTRPEHCESEGDWDFSEEGAVASSDGRCSLSIRTPQNFLCELTMLGSGARETGRFGIVFESIGSLSAELVFEPASGLVTLNPGGASENLQADFDWAADHLIRIECDHRHLKVEIDNRANAFALVLNEPVDRLSIFSEDIPISLRSLQLTEGFEELFENDHGLDDNGWSVVGDGSHTVLKGELTFPESGLVLSKGGRVEDVEVAVNFRTSRSGRLSLELTDDGDAAIRLTVGSDLTVDLAAESHRFPLPADVELHQYHQLRMIKLNDRTSCYFDDVRLGEFAVGDVPVRMRIAGAGPGVGVEMIRVTRI